MTDQDRFILNVLREATIRWSGRSECFRRHGELRKEGFLKNGKVKLKWYWHCAKCNSWSREQKDFEVDHIIEIGPFNGDWNLLMKKMFCGQDNLQLLCITCHKKKSSGFNAALRYARKPLPD